jgi:hypothetical protein
MLTYLSNISTSFVHELGDFLTKKLEFKDLVRQSFTITFSNFFDHKDPTANNSDGVL